MNQNEEIPESLGGLGDLLPADVLKKRLSGFSWLAGVG